MRSVVLVALDVLREAAHRRWLLAMGVLVTLFAGLLAYSLELEVAGGMLASTKLFGMTTQLALLPTADALRPLFVALAFVVYMAAVPISCLALSDLAPELLAPGRVELLLSLPLRRWELLAGTYLGSLAIAMLGTGYTALVLTVLFGLKAGVWSSCIFAGALSACAAWAAVYGVMLASAVFVRSSALSGSLGLAFFGAGLFLTRPEVSALFPAGLKRNLFLAVMAPVPRFWSLSSVGPAIAGYGEWDGALVSTLIGTLIFGVACVMLAVWEFERRDY